MDIFRKAKLPQKDPNQQDRLKQLEEFREKFKYDFSVVDNVPISEIVPDEAKAGTGWSLKIVETSYKLRRNWERIQDEHNFVFEKTLPYKSVSEIVKLLTDQDLVGILDYSNPDLGIALEDKRPTSFEEYFSLFKQIKVPNGSDKFECDKDFADYFLGGLNPLMVTCVKELKGNLKLDESHLTQHELFQDDSVEDMIAEKRLFIADYEVLDMLEPGEHPDQSKYVYAPMVVLGMPKNGSDIEVIAVQYGQDPLYPIVTPKSGKWEWLVAKTIVKIADSNYHEVASHLGLTHLVIEPIVISSYRNLAQNHPLHELLIPHFEGTIPINALAVRKLINVGGVVEQLLCPKIESAYKILEIVRNTFDFTEAFLPTSLKKRGVEQGSSIKNYPYRDDALLVWNAIKTWAQDFVNETYSSNNDVAEDFELQAWAKEIQSPEAGRVNGFIPQNGLKTKQELANIITMIIFTASAQHAAVNFPQGKAAAVPYQPLAGYAPAPTETGLTEADAIEFLPPRDRALKQLHTLTLLGETYYTKLGYYNLGTFSNKGLVPKLWKFQARLKRIEKEIDSRNEERRTPYPYLKPSSIPQSINI